jgi:hypothetical protein
MRHGEVERLVEAGAAVLGEHVAARDADIGRAVLHVRRHVGGANDDHAHARIARGDDELAGLLRVLREGKAGGGEQRRRFVEDAALGEREGDHGVRRSA